MAYTEIENLTFLSETILGSIPHIPYIFPHDYSAVSTQSEVNPSTALADLNYEHPIVFFNGSIGTDHGIVGIAISEGDLNADGSFDPQDLINTPGSLVLLGCPPWTRKGRLP